MQTEAVYEMRVPPGPPLAPPPVDEGRLRRLWARLQTNRGREATAGYLFLSL